MASGRPGDRRDARHLVWSVTRHAWVRAYELQPGEFVRPVGNVVVPVDSVGPLKTGLVEVYGIEVEFFHNYFVGRGEDAMLVHNGPECLVKPTSAEPRGARGPRSPRGATGPHSGREFDPAAAGGPVRQLTTDRIKITNRGIDAVERHIARFGPDEANQTMIQRLRDIAGGRLQVTQADRNFYSHELRESVRYRRLGWRDGQPADPDAARTLWNNAHTATLEDYRLREGPGVLYHPDIPW